MYVPVINNAVVYSNFPEERAAAANTQSKPASQAARGLQDPASPTGEEGRVSCMMRGSARAIYSGCMVTR